MNFSDIIIVFEVIFIILLLNSGKNIFIKNVLMW